jgi:hypothetical protein
MLAMEIEQVHMVYLHNIPQLAAQKTAAIHTIDINAFVLE